MGPRSALAAASALLASAALAGCDAQSPPAKAYADPVALASYSTDTFAAQLERMDAAVGARGPWTGSQPLNAKYLGYTHLALGNESFDRESETAIAGHPPAVTTSWTSDPPGGTLNFTHPASGAYTYYLLREPYSSIAATLWAAVPYSEPQGGQPPYSAAYCGTIPLNLLCAIRGAITATAGSTRATDAHERVRYDADGHAELRTQVSWDALLHNALSPITAPADLLAGELPAGLTDRMVPARLWLDETGFPVKGEVNFAYGEGAEKFQMQAGFEVLGASAPADFVLPQSSLDWTVIDRATFDAEVQRLSSAAGK